MIRMFEIPSGGTWIQKDGDWYRDDVIPVYREPQGGWAAKSLHKRETIWVLAKVFGQNPNGSALPEWVECQWDYQAGRWVVMTGSSTGTGKSIATASLEDRSGGMYNLWLSFSDPAFIQQQGQTLDIKKPCLVTVDGEYFFKPNINEFEYPAMYDVVTHAPYTPSNNYPLKFWKSREKTFPRSFHFGGQPGASFVFELPDVWSSFAGTSFQDIGVIGVQPLEHSTTFSFTRRLPNPFVWTPRFEQFDPAFDNEYYFAHLTFLEI